jgi:hypothetical protein
MPVTDNQTEDKFNQSINFDLLKFGYQKADSQERFRAKVVLSALLAKI